MSWFPLPVAPTHGHAAAHQQPFGFLPPTIPLLPFPTATPAATANSAAVAGAATAAVAAPAHHKRPYDAQEAGGAHGHKFPRNEDAGGFRGRGGGRGGRGRGGSRGGRGERDAVQEDPAAAAAAAAPSCTPGFLADGRPDLSMYLTPAGAAAPAQPRAPAAASAAAADAPAAPAAPARPVYCQSFMHNLCPLRSCDAKDDDQSSGASHRARCEFVHDEEFRRTFLARAQFRATNWTQNRKETSKGAHARDDAPATDGRLPGLKAPVKESALLRKLLSSELRVESSRVLQAIRYLVTHQCLAPQRDRIRQQQRQAEEEYQRSKKQSQQQQEQAAELDEKLATVHTSGEPGSAAVASSDSAPTTAAPPAVTPALT